MTLPLEGIKILDSAHQYPGPYCSMLLGDLGAEIIKVEQPKIGDPARANPGFFRGLNRNKKSITLNLKVPAAKEILLRLVKEADVFNEGFRPGVVKRLGIDYETFRKINPRLIYCSISGYGQDGPYRDLPGHDLNYMAMAGLLDSIRDKDGNHVPPGYSHRRSVFRDVCGHRHYGRPAGQGNRPERSIYRCIHVRWAPFLDVHPIRAFFPNRLIRTPL